MIANNSTPSEISQMLKRFPTLFVLFVLCLAAARAQRPSPMPADTDVVKISTNLIQVDVTVTDKNGKVVRDLRPDELEIYENGKKQSISNFSFISSVRETPVAAPVKPDKTAVALPPSPVRPESVKRAIALVVDDLTLSFESTYYVRRALKKFVDEQMQEGDLVAIVRTGAGIGALQQFTTDKRQLYAAIERVRWNPVGNGGIGAFAPMEGKPPADPNQPEPRPGERTPEGVEREFNDFRESVFATGTLGAISYVIRGMQELPGRKSVMLLSDGFALFNLNAEGFRESSRVLESLHRLVDQANRASVVVYTMDARGLVYTGLTAADDTSGRTADKIEQELLDRRTKLFDTQEGLVYLARQTGGISIRNSNDLSGGIRKILDDQSYYLIGYVPDEDTFDPKTRRFNKLEVKVTRSGARVRYRSGFFGVADRETASSAPAVSAERRILDALMSPFAANQISLRLNSLFGAGGQAGPFVRSLVHVRAQDLKFENLPDGSKKAMFDIIGVAFGDNGGAADQISKTYTLTVKDDMYERIVKRGFVYDFTFTMKKPGAYQLRVAIRDHGSDKVGSANQFIEVPNLKKNRLVLSGAVLENVALKEWQMRSQGKPAGESDPLTDTSLRQFKNGSVLNYGLSIFNARPGSVEGGGLTWQMRLFRDGKLIFEGKPQSATSKNLSLPQPTLAGSLLLGKEMPPGDYVVQIAVTDKLARGKYNTATQFVQFEIVE